MEKLKNIFSRVRWISVIGLLLVIAVVAFLIMAIPSGYSVQGSVGVSIKANPSTVKVGEFSKIEIEVKNMDKNRTITVNVDAKTYDENFLFNQTQEVSQRDLIIGPKESRKLTFDVKPSLRALPGKYGVNVKAREKSYVEGAEDTVYIKVVKE